MASFGATTLLVTPLREGETTVRVVAWNRAGHATDEFQVTVVTDPAEIEALEGTLEAFGRAMLSSASMTIGRRLESGGGGESRMSLSSSAADAGQVPFGGDAAGLAAMARTRAFFLNEAPFGAGSTGLEAPLTFFDPTRDTFELSLTDEDGTAEEAGVRWGLWGAGQMQTFDGGGEGAAMQFSGSLVSPYVGLDLSGERFTVGVAMVAGGRPLRLRLPGGDDRLGDAGPEPGERLPLRPHPLRGGDRGVGHRRDRQRRGEGGAGSTPGREETSEVAMRLGDARPPPGSRHLLGDAAGRSR